MSNNKKNRVIQLPKPVSEGYPKTSPLGKTNSFERRAPMLTKIIHYFQNKPSQIIMRTELVKLLHPHLDDHSFKRSARLVDSCNHATIKSISRARKILVKLDKRKNVEYLKYIKAKKGWIYVVKKSDT